MSLDLIAGIPLVLATTCLVFWVQQWRQSRKTGVAAMCAALVFLEIALLIGVFYWSIHAVTRLPALPQLLQHAAVLTSAYWLQVFCLYLRQPDQIAALKTRPRARLLWTALFGLVVLWIVGPLAANLPAVSSEYGYPPMVQLYLFVYVAYLGLAMADIFASSRQAKYIPRRWLRLGLRLLGLGSLLGLAYVLWRAAFGITRALGVTLPWADTGPGGFSTYAGFLAICSLTAGVMVPPIGNRWDATKAARRLHPLWMAVTSQAPELVFAERQGSRLRAYVTEIRDVLIGPLKPYLDPAVAERARQLGEAAGLVDELEPTVEAAVIAAALRAREHGHPPSTVRPITIAIPDDTDESADVDRLVRIAAAFARSAIVASVEKEFADRDYDPTH